MGRRINRIPITRFIKRFRYMRNDYPAKTPFEGRVYPTSEHAFQAAKTSDLKKRNWIGLATTTNKAKKRAQTLELPADWEERKVKVMAEVVTAKFKANPHLLEKLLKTEERHLSDESDPFWGKVDGEGKNYMGKILMGIRTVASSNGGKLR